MSLCGPLWVAPVWDVYASWVWMSVSFTKFSAIVSSNTFYALFPFSFWDPYNVNISLLDHMLYACRRGLLNCPHFIPFYVQPVISTAVSFSW